MRFEALFVLSQRLVASTVGIVLLLDNPMQSFYNMRSFIACLSSFPAFTRGSGLTCFASLLPRSLQVFFASHFLLRHENPFWVEKKRKKKRRRRNVTAFHQWRRPFEFEVPNTQQKAKRGREHRGRRRTKEKAPDFFLFICVSLV